MDKIITLRTLINTYYEMCDNWRQYKSDTSTHNDLLSGRDAIIDSIYTLIYCKSPCKSNTVKLFMLLNNDISGERLTADMIISKFRFIIYGRK